MPRAGLEPARIAPHAPQTCAATNYATSAFILTKIYLFAGSAAFEFDAELEFAAGAVAFELAFASTG